MRLQYGKLTENLFVNCGVFGVPVWRVLFDGRVFRKFSGAVGSAKTGRENEPGEPNALGIEFSFIGRRCGVVGISYHFGERDTAVCDCSVFCGVIFYGMV